MHDGMSCQPFGSLSTIHDVPNIRDRPLVEPRRRAATTWQVRRAEQYIEAHWNEPITIASLARATAASTRSIFYHFKTSRGQSPMSFLKEVRLEHARYMLEHSGVSRSVTQVAVECGFGNLGHFAGDYLKRFGERPSETLKRGKYELALGH
ncbi:MAG TPA: helix-turn-helix domain-containing protein [Xanthobacteraceae bacterium]|jgi:transcriptional regulator GlxA family with amidase domain